MLEEIEGLRLSPVLSDKLHTQFLGEAKPVQLESTVVGAITPETNMWESTSIAAEEVNVVAFGVVSEADEADGIELASDAEARERANRVRFAPVKKWDDYTHASKQTIIRHVAERILKHSLVQH